MKKQLFFLLFSLTLISSISLTACSSSNEIQKPTKPVSTITEPYPFPNKIFDVDPYPPPGTNIENIPTKEIVASPIRLIKPVLDGEILVHGSGPSSLPIFVVDITMMGTVIGEGEINSDGLFSIPVNPLEKNHRIGISLGNLEGTGWSAKQFNSEEFYGEGALQVPLVGFFYDTTLILEGE